LGRGRASESKKRKEMRRGRNVVNRQGVGTEARASREREKDGPLRVRRRIIITFRKVLFRGFLEEEEDWKESEGMERRGGV
jgi:hypothetical protein